jgi:hypothetical protein
MNTPTPVSQPARRPVWRWVFLAAAIVGAPFVAVGLAVLSFVTLDSDAATLRREVMAATHSDWHTKAQVSVGWMTIGAVRQGLRFVPHEHMDEARDALAAVHHASVGVYERSDRDRADASGQLISRTDETMQRRGWTRLVGVVDGGDTVMIYSTDRKSGDRLDLCIAVVNDRELVVVSTAVDTEAVDRLVDRYAPGDLKSKLKLAKL